MKSDSLLKYSLVTILLVTLQVGCSSKKEPETTDSSTKDITKADSIPDSLRSGQFFEIKLPDGSTKRVEYIMSGVPFDFNTTPDTVGGITYTPASQWTALGPSGIRAYRYHFGPMENDIDSATLEVFYSEGLNKLHPDSIIGSMIDEISLPDKRDPRKAAIRYNLSIDSMTAHVMTMLGSYRSSEAKSSTAVQKDRYRLIAVVIETAQGNVLFKLFGPDRTVTIMVEAFMPMLKAIKKT